VNVAKVGFRQGLRLLTSRYGSLRDCDILRNRPCAGPDGANDFTIEYHRDPPPKMTTFPALLC